MDLLDVLRKAGFSGDSLSTAYAVAMAESSGNARAFNGNRTTGDQSYGLFQINMLGAMGPERRRQYGLSSNDALYDPVTNAKVAYRLSNGGKDWSPWSAYKSGAYRKYLGQSGAAVGGAGAPTAEPPPAEPEPATPTSGVVSSNLGEDFAPDDPSFAPDQQDFAGPVASEPEPFAQLEYTTKAAYAGGATDLRDRIIANAMSFIGTPYSWGGGTRSGTSYGVYTSGRGDGRRINGVDCSGLMYAAFGLAGINLPRIARDQLGTGTRVGSFDNLRPGDLIGYGNGYHVSMYIGDGKVIDAPTAGKTVQVRDIGSWEAREGWGVRLNLPGD